MEIWGQQENDILSTQHKKLNRIDTNCEGEPPKSKVLEEIRKCKDLPWDTVLKLQGHINALGYLFNRLWPYPPPIMACECAFFERRKKRWGEQRGREEGGKEGKEEVSELVS